MIKLLNRNIFNKKSNLSLRFTLLTTGYSFLFIIAILNSGCNYITHNTVISNSPYDSNSSYQEPNYDISLENNYQDFTSYFYMGNRIENFTAYFNTFYRSQEDFNDAYEEYRASLISFYNRRLDSLGITPPISAGVKDKLDKAIERSSKIIQFHKNSRYIDDAVLIIGKAYYFEEDYFKAERTFNEFLSKFSGSELADEAILFLGQTKTKIGKREEGERIFKNLVKNSTDNEIRSLASRDLGIIAYNNGNFEDAVSYFKASIDFSKNDERKAEGQFILAKILSEYKPQLSAEEYKKVINYTSDFDLIFYARLNYAKGLMINKDFKKSTEELEEIRKKYRDEPAFTQLVDLEIANNLYLQKKYDEAMQQYYEVIVKYPGTSSSADAYYYLAKHEEDVNNDYLEAFVNYRKSTEESIVSDFYKESAAKSSTYEKYFALQGEVSDSVNTEIPTVNAKVEKYRRNYNIEKGIEQENEQGSDKGFDNRNQGPPPEETPKGDGKGKPGGFKNSGIMTKMDSLENIPPVEDEQQVDPNANPNEGIIDPPAEVMEEINKLKNEKQDSSLNGGETENKDGEEVKTVNEDSIKAVQEALMLKEKEDKAFNAYYELAELFMYNINQNDSAEHYLKLLLTKFPEADKQVKILYTLGNFYKNINRTADADQTFGKIVSTYPNTIYANESRKILGMKSENDSLMQNPLDAIFTRALNFFNTNKFSEAVSELREVEIRYPQDSMVAKSLYSIGWIYENKLVNKDSSLLYYKKLKEKFPESEYTLKVNPMLDYIASLEVKDTTDSSKINPVNGDTTNTEGKEIIKEPVKNESGEQEEQKEATNNEEETKLSKEEIDKLLKETETENPSGE